MGAFARLLPVGLAVLSAGLLSAGVARGQTVITGDCYSDDFLPIIGNHQVYDLTISLWSHPTTAERAQYEEVIEHFARGVYEMTNGVQKIRNVVVHQDGHQKRFADVIWAQGSVSSPQGAVSHSGGILDDLGKIYLFDIAQDRNDPNVPWVDLVRGNSDQRKLLGYILAHEFGHFAFSLADEYDRGETDDTREVVSVMSVAQLAVGVGGTPDDLQWLNFSTTESRNWNIHGATSQQNQRWGAASWPFLLQSCASRRRQTTAATGVLIQDTGETEYVSHFPKHIQWSGFAAVAPTSADTWVNPNDNVTYPTMLPDLYDFPGATDPLEHLNVTWMDSSNVEMDLILDISGSMTGTPIASVIAAANAFVSGVPIGRTTLGVTTFESVVNPDRVPMRPMAAQSDVTAVQASISAITVGDDTAMFAGAKQGLEKLQAYRTANGTSALQVVFLLSDGNDNASGGVTETEVQTLYQNAGVRMHTVGYADRDASEAFFPPLERLAAGTGGVFHRGITAVADLTEAMRIALGDALSIQDIELSGLGTPLFPAEVVYSQFVFNIGYTLNTGGAVDFAVIGANGLSVARDVFVKSEPDGSFLATIIVDEPAIAAGGIGQWQLVPSFSGAGGAVTSQRLFAVPGVQAPVELIVSTRKLNYVYPEPIELYARTIKDGDVTGVDLTASLRGPAGMLLPVTLNDDGFGNDAAADDGLYSGQIGDYGMNGVYTLSVVSKNTGNAVTIVPGGEPGPGGAPTDPTYVPIGLAFSRKQTALFRVDGVVADDHGNSVALATDILPDYAPHPGKIETVADRDFFRVVGVDTTQDLSIRVYHTAFGMVPEVSVFRSNGVTPVAYANPFTATARGGYLSITVPQASVQEGLIFVVEDLNDQAGGTYTVDVGPPTEADTPAPSQLKVESRDSRQNEANLSGIETRIQNRSGRDISSFKVHYYFDTEYFQTPVLEDWWSSASAVRLIQRGVEQYAVEFDYAGFTLPAGESLPDENENAIGLHYGNWSPWDRTNDFSNNLMSDFTENAKIAVFDSAGRLIYGQTPVVRPPRQPVVDVVAWSREDKLSDPLWTSPDIYIQNRGDDISNLVVYYYFTAENGQVPLLEDWHSPTAAVSLQSLGSGKYRIRYNYAGFTLPHITATPFPSRTLVGLHYGNWSTVNKNNDASNNRSAVYAVNNKIQVFDGAGNRIFGVANP